MKEIEKIKENKQFYFYYQVFLFGIFLILILALYVWIDAFLNNIGMLLTALLGLMLSLSLFVASVHLHDYYEILLKIENLKKEIEGKITK